MQVVRWAITNLWNSFFLVMINSCELMHANVKRMKWILSTARNYTQLLRTWWLTISSERLTVILKWKCSSEISTDARTGILEQHSICLIVRDKGILTFSACTDFWAIVGLMPQIWNSLQLFEELRVVGIRKWILMNSLKLLNQYMLKCMIYSTLKIKDNT